MSILPAYLFQNCRACDRKDSLTYRDFKGPFPWKHIENAYLDEPIKMFGCDCGNFIFQQGDAEKIDNAMRKQLGIKE